MGLHSMLILILSIILSFSLVNAEQAYQKLARNLHNQYRARHYARPLVSDEDLHARALWCAQHYAKKGNIDHSCPHKAGAGENLWRHFGKVSHADAARGAIKGWYIDERPKHNYRLNAFQHPSGHFSQLVWKGSNKFGFGVVQSSRGTFGVALYRPHGNVRGQFLKNVARPTTG